MKSSAALNVVVVTTSFPLRDGATSGIFVARLMDHIPDDVQLEIITPACRGSLAQRRKSNIHVTPVGYAPQRWQILAQLPGGIPAALKNKRWLYLLVPSLLGTMWFSCLRAAAQADVLHANWAINGCIAGMAGRLRRVPVVTSLRGSDVASARCSTVSRFILHMALMCSRRVVCVSHAISTWVAQNFPQYRAKLCVIENGIDAVFLNVGRARAANTSPVPFTLVTVCNLIPGKGVDLIIRAMSRLKAHPGIVLQIAGDGPELGRLRDLVAELALSDRVRLLGALAPENVPAQLATADAFVLASHSEGRPNAVLEAMAAGLPIIASDIEGVNEIVHDDETGLLFQPGDVAGLAACIARLHDAADLRARLGLAAHAFIVSNGLTWEETARRYSELYRQVAQEMRP